MIIIDLSKIRKYNKKRFINQMMRYEELNRYQNASIQSLLKQQLQCPNKNNSTIIYAKSLNQNFNVQCIKMALQLLERDGQTWLKVIQRFSQTQFKMTFSLCYKHLGAYKALATQVTKQGQYQHKSAFQKYIQDCIDSSFELNNNVPQYILQIYFQYLNSWSKDLANRTLYCLQKIQKRLQKSQNLYHKMSLNQKIVFFRILSDIVFIHEQQQRKRLSLRAFWNSIPNTIDYLKNQIQTKGFVHFLIDNLSHQASHGLKNSEIMKSLHNQEAQKIDILYCLISNVKVSIIQQIYVQSAQRISKLMISSKIIDYRKYEQNNIQQVLLLENSLIYNVISDDLPSLFQQFILSLGKKVPNFLKYFLLQASAYLSESNADQASCSDIILKLCILSKQIIYHINTNQQSLDVKQIINKLIIMSDSRSQLIQIKTLKLMHYFKQVLPDTYFQSYHQSIFRILKTYIQNYNSIQYHHHPTIQLQDHHLLSSTTSTPIYTKISFYQCVHILNQQTQKQQDQDISTRIRKKKFNNISKLQNLFQKHMHWISNKLIDILIIQGYCQQQLKIFEILRNLLNKYPTISQKNTVFLIKNLCKQFQKQISRIRQQNQRERQLKKVFFILDCLMIVCREIQAQIYFNCQQYLSPIISLVRQQFCYQLQDQLLKFIPLMIQKANSITVQLNNILIYAKQIFLKQNCNLSVLQDIIKELCRNQISKSIKYDWNQTILFYVNIFLEYILSMHQNQSIHLYYKSWYHNIDLMQLFLQTYEEQISSSVLIREKLAQMVQIIQKIQRSQKTCQLLMTMHHVTNGATKLYSFDRMLFIDNYKQKYTLHLIHITFVDLMIKNFKSRAFEFQQINNQVYTFIKDFRNFLASLNQNSHNCTTSANDSFPINSINTSQYTENAINSLFGLKIIDIQQSTQLKNNFLDQRYLIRSAMFN